MRLLLVLILGSFLAGLTVAQEAFPDVPRNHWAHDAVAKLKSEGLLKGYPDGTFKGSRPATRYELAVSLASFWSSAKALSKNQNLSLADLNSRFLDESMLDNLGSLKMGADRLLDFSGQNRSDIISIQGQLDELRLKLRQIREELDQVQVERQKLSQRVSGKKSVR